MFFFIGCETNEQKITNNYVLNIRSGDTIQNIPGVYISRIESTPEYDRYNIQSYNHSAEITVKNNKIITMKKNY